MNHNREERLFQLALTQPADQRAAFLDRACGNDAALRALVLEKALGKRTAFLDAMCEADPSLRQRLEARLAAPAQSEYTSS